MKKPHNKKKKPSQAARQNKPTWLPLVLVAILALTQIVAPIPHFFGYFPKAWVSIGSLICLNWLLWDAWQRRHLAIQNSLILLALLLMLVWMIVTLLWASNLYYGLLEINNFMAAVVFAWVLLLSLPQLMPQQGLQQKSLTHSERATVSLHTKHEDLLSKLMALIFIASFLLAILGILQYLFHVDWVPVIAPPSGTFGNKNMASHYAVMTMPLGLGLWLWSKKIPHIWFYAISVALMMTFIVYTETRASWIASVVSLSLLSLGAYSFYRHCKTTAQPSSNGFTIRRQRRLSAVCAALLLILMVHLSSDGVRTFYNRANELVGSFVSVESGSAKERLTIWQNSLAMLQDHALIGVGIGNWPIHYPRYQQAATIDETAATTMIEWRRTHNDYLQWAVELGLPFLVLFLLIVALLLRTSWKLLRHSYQQSNRLFYLTLGIVMSLGGGAVTALFSFPLRLPVTIATFVTYIGILVWLDRYLLIKSQVPEGRAVEVTQKNGLLLMLVVSLILTMLVAIGHWRGYQAWSNYSLATGAYQQEQSVRSIELSELAFAYNPFDTEKLIFAMKSHLKLGQQQRAIELLEKARQQFPYRKQVLLDLGSSYLATQQYQKALEIHQLFAESTPQSYLAQSNLGSTYYYLKDYANMVIHYKKALAIDSEGDQADNYQELIDYYQ